jgi:hypothetical protein
MHRQKFIYHTKLSLIFIYGLNIMCRTTTCNICELTNKNRTFHRSWNHSDILLLCVSFVRMKASDDMFLWRYNKTACTWRQRYGKHLTLQGSFVEQEDLKEWNTKFCSRVNTIVTWHSRPITFCFTTVVILYMRYNNTVCYWYTIAHKFTFTVAAVRRKTQWWRGTRKVFSGNLKVTVWNRYSFLYIY